LADANDRSVSDPHQLSRFVQAQEHKYRQALNEIRSGRKCSRWMCYIFPQFDGLGFSSMSRYYSIKSRAEAEAYLNHLVLGPRLVECADAAFKVEGRSAQEIFGSPHEMKLRSCVTLFASFSPAGSVFHRLLAKYFQGGARWQDAPFIGYRARRPVGHNSGDARIRVGRIPKTGRLLTSVTR
jgi:uncharacterized protein (DUF1810 family)